MKLSQNKIRRALFGSFRSCVDVCGKFDFANRDKDALINDGVDGDLYFNWAGKHTTPDQLCIEEYLNFKKFKGSVLHVGVGSSGFAERWADRLSIIYGTTIADAEVKVAESLGKENYVVKKINKYSLQMLEIGSKFDIIIDNNPTYGACCKYHFFSMWNMYRELLKDGGSILTETTGMSWIIPGADRRWSINDADLAWIASSFGFQISESSEYPTVRSLLRC